MVKTQVKVAHVMFECVRSNPMKTFIIYNRKIETIKSNVSDNL